jgi:polyisoprenoid-binding protein YceI
MKRMNMVISAIALLAASSVMAAEPFTIDKAHSDVSFKIRHLVSKVTGKFDDFSGSIDIDQNKPAASTVEFRIKATSVDTGEPARDKHLRSADFFDVEKFPEITFKSTSVRAASKKNHYNVTGVLSMHGVNKTITLPVEFLGFVKDPWGNEKAGFELSTTLNRKEFGVNWNKALDAGGVMLGDDVDVNINLETAKTKAAAAASQKQETKEQKH